MNQQNVFGVSIGFLQDWLEKYHEQCVEENTHDCKYGHINCSTRRGGLCSDHVHQFLEEQHS